MSSLTAPETADADIDLLILAAMPEEAAAIRALATGMRAVPHPLSGASVRAEVGTLRSAGAHARIALVTTGIGTAAAATVASWALTTFEPRAVVSVGSCGGLADGIGVGTVIVGTEYAYSIADATAFGYAPGQVPGAPVRFAGGSLGADEAAARAEAITEAARAAGLAAQSGLMISGDAFVVAATAERMRAQFPGALSADMETTALAHTALLHSRPFFAVRAVSDLCSPRADEEFHIGLDVAAEHSARALVAALPQLTGSAGAPTVPQE